MSSGPAINPNFLKRLSEDANAPSVSSREGEGMVPPGVPLSSTRAGEVETPIVDASASADYEVESPSPALSLEEVVQLGAVDSAFFNQVWFPKTFRQAPALFHAEIDRILDNPLARYVNIQVNRDGAKTTKLRAFAAKRVAYGISRTILYVAQNETKAKQSVGWMKHQIQTNHKFCTAFGLNKGQPWSDEHICILHGPEQHKVNIIAFGISGGVRGVNIEDYRPDLIVVDDVMDDENSATKEQREKIINRVLGAVKESLAPATEVPDAKMAILNTPQDFEDLSEEAKKDTQFYSASFGCWTKETEGLPVEEQESSWPARYPSETLRAEKLAAIARNRYSIFAREKECILIVPEDCAFRAEHLNYFGEGEKEPEPPHHEMWIEIAIDPVPPPTKGQLDRGLKDKDYESFSVGGRWKGKYYLLDQVHNRGHDPRWTVNEFFRLCLKWNPRKVTVETIAYQATLAWILRQAMQKAGRYWPIMDFPDKRKKYNRILDGLTGISSEGALYVRKTQATFISQFSHYPGKNPGGNKDDDIESAAVVMESLQKGGVGDVDDVVDRDEGLIEALADYRGAP
jgi:phage terminase large subunit-like protein